MTTVSPRADTVKTGLVTVEMVCGSGNTSLPLDFDALVVVPYNVKINRVGSRSRITWKFRMKDPEEINMLKTQLLGIGTVENIVIDIR